MLDGVGPPDRARLYIQKHLIAVFVIKRWDSNDHFIPTIILLIKFIKLTGGFQRPTNRLCDHAQDQGASQD